MTKVDLAEPGIRDRLEATGADHLRLELGYVAVRASVVLASPTALVYSILPLCIQYVCLLLPTQVLCHRCAVALP